jgi:hypothetical protein
VTGRRVRHGPDARREALGGTAQFDGAGTGNGPGPGVYSPSRHDPVVRAASVVVGGPAGRRLASASGFWRALPILILLACTVLSFGVVQKQHCRAQGWSSPDQFWHACYSDIPVLYGSASLGTSARPGLVDALSQGGLGQPPVAGAFMWVTSSFISGKSADSMRNYFDLSAVVLALVLAFGVAAAALALGRHSWDAAHLALSPVLITAGLISYELLAVTLTAVALFVLARGRPLFAGVVLGLAVSCAPQVAVIALVVLLLAGRYLRNVVGVAFAAGTLVTWFVLRVLLLPGLAGGLGPAWTEWRRAVPGYGSLWLVPQLLGASDPQPATSWGGKIIQALIGWLFAADSLSGTTTTIFDILLFVLLAAVVLRFTVFSDPQAYRSAALTDTVRADPAAMGRFVTDRVAPLGLAVLAITLCTQKSLPVQASLVLLPLMALTGLRWRDHLIWAATELVYFVGIWLYIAGDTTPDRGLPASFYLVLVLARLAGIGWIGLAAVRVYRSSPQSPLPVDPDPGPSGDGSLPWELISSQPGDKGRLLDDRGADAPHPAG